MANLDVQPKKRSILPWILLLLGIAALLFFVFRNKGKNTTTTTTDSTKTTTMATTHAADSSVGVTGGNWDKINFSAPAASYDEITGNGVTVQGADNYAIYSLGEDVLFASDKATINPAAEANLKQVAASIQKRYGSADIRVYGFTDAKGTPGYNMELANQRAAAVRDWMVHTGGITDSRITLHPIGEGQPVASNATPAGRQQNRRVSIVARNNKP